MTTAFELLHRSVQQKLWDMQWTELRPVQAKAIVHLRTGGRDCIIGSPTASGKTEAAFLPVLSSIVEDPVASVRAMYIGPLKALINDQFRRVEELCARMEMPVHKWHGDVDASARQRLLSAPGGVLLITPESLEAMFVLRPTQLPKIFARLSYVVVDELHAFLETERGAQLRSLLHRLKLRAGCDPVRIGLSATIAEPERAQRWLRPVGPPATYIFDDGAASGISLRVRGLWRRPSDEAPENDDPSLAELARNILMACAGRTNLVFANAKSRIEELADELTSQAKSMDLVDEVVVHHGSLSKQRREYAEERLRGTRPCTAVCSNTLEMGIDIGEIDDIVQVSAPWSVASLVQRLGRSGRRADKQRTLRAYFVEDSPSEGTEFWDRLHLQFMQGIAVIELLLAGFLEPPETERAHLSTLVHQLLSTLAETGGIAASQLYERLLGGGIFGAMNRRDFGLLLRELGQRELLQQMEDRSLILGVRAQKIVEHYSFYAAFRAESEFRVVHGSDEIGSIAMPPPPGDHLILAGRRWRVEYVDVERREVQVAPATGRRRPWFRPQSGRIHRAIHEKMRALLSATDRPKYLDTTAFEILQAARAAASTCGYFRPSVQEVANGLRIFVWKGSRIQQTIAIALARAGLKCSDERVGFDVEGRPSEIRKVLREFSRNPDAAGLAAFADEKLRLREVSGEKFDFCLPPELWRGAYAREELDADGAAAAADECVASMLRFAETQIQGGGGYPLPFGEAGRPQENLAALPIHSLDDAIAIVAAPMVPAKAIPVRTVIVPNEAFAHAMRRALIERGCGRSLLGARFLTVAGAAKQILSMAGVEFTEGEEDYRSERLPRIFRHQSSLQYFDRDLLCNLPGWEGAFAQTIHELEAAGLQADMLDATNSARARDLAKIMRALDEDAGTSLTRARITQRARGLLQGEAPNSPVFGPVLAIVSGHETEATASFIASLPDVTLAIFSANPPRESHANDVARRYGRRAVDALHAVSSAALRTERDILARYLFEEPTVLADQGRQRSVGPDGTVSLEEYAGVVEELDACVAWVEREVLERGTPLDQLAVFLPRLDPLAGMLVDRLTRVPWFNSGGAPAIVLGGMLASRMSAGARVVSVIRALRQHLHRDLVWDLLPVLRVPDGARPLSKADAAMVLSRLGTLGGTPTEPDRAWGWGRLALTTETALAEKLARKVGSNDNSDENSAYLERALACLRAIRPALTGLSEVAHVCSAVQAKMPEIAGAVLSFVEEHLDLSDPRAVKLIANVLRACGDDPRLIDLSGETALSHLEDAILKLRAVDGRFGDPAITIAPLETHAGLQFRAVRIIGLAEGAVPSSSREDPILPDAERGLVLPRRSDRALAQLHAVHRAIRGAQERVVLSTPRMDVDGSHCEPSSIFIEAATALGRPDAVTSQRVVRIPDSRCLERDGFGPARRDSKAFRSRETIATARWLERSASEGVIPESWLLPDAIEIRRLRTLLDQTRPPDSLDGFFDLEVPFPPIPGLTAAHPTSASRLRDFIGCPHKFLFSSVFHWREPERLPEINGLDALAYGALFHRTVELLYRAHGEMITAGGCKIEELEGEIDAAVHAGFDNKLGTHPLVNESVCRQEKARLRRDVTTFVDLDLQETKRFVDVERRFGWETPQGISFGAVQIHVRGSIDRLDALEREGFVLVRDLKSGRERGKKERGRPVPDLEHDLQLVVYGLVTQANAKAWGVPSRVAVAYVHPSDARNPDREFRDDFVGLCEIFDQKLGAQLPMLMERAFPRTPDPADCEYCPFKPVCGPRAFQRANSVLDDARGAVQAFREEKRKES